MIINKGRRSGRKHAIVTGGAGFLGSHLVDSLLEDGYRVTSLDNFGSGRRENLAHINSSRFESIRHDVRDPFPDFERVDQIYHFASRASPDDFRSHAIAIALTNSWGTRNAFEIARKHDARVVLASTSEVYGNPDVHPQPEEYNGNVNVRGPRAPYDESKRFAESLGEAYDHKYNLDIRTVRIFNTYGPRMRDDDGRVIPNFLRQAIHDEDLTVYGDGTQTRSFCYVSDTIRGIRTLGEAASDGASGAVCNLGSTHEVEIKDLAEIVIDTFDTEAGITFRDLPDDDPRRRCPDLTQTKQVLGWSPTVDLRTGLKRTAKAFRIKEKT